MCPGKPVKCSPQALQRKGGGPADTGVVVGRCRGNQETVKMRKTVSWREAKVGEDGMDGGTRCKDRSGLQRVMVRKRDKRESWNRPDQTEEFMEACRKKIVSKRASDEEMAAPGTDKGRKM